MTTYDNNNRGTLGRNKRREKDTHPEFAGKCEIDGVGYWISGWVKEAQGERFFSLSFKRKDDAPQKPRDKAEAWKAGASDDSDIPF
jgi:hypothetical protein